MKTTLLLIAAMAIAVQASASRADAGGIEVKLGTTIDRTWEQVKADKYAYGPRQQYDPASGETHVWLPYGANPNLYDETHGVLSDPSANSSALFHSSNGDSNALLTYRLHFNQRIGLLRFKAGWVELGLHDNTAAGVEYSEDGLAWKTIREVRGSDKPASTIEPFVANFRADDLNTDTLYIRFYTRDPSAPEASGPGRWLQVRMSGSPDWGDVATTFFPNQLQVWAAPVKPGTPPRAEQTLALPAPRVSASGKPKENRAPWGIASGAEWSADYPRFDPMLERAGVRWLRLFPEWQNIEPRQGQWDWKGADALAANARANHMQLLGVWAYLAPWASADGGTRKFPIRDIRFWRDYVSATAARYRNDVQYWEVWNEFNGSFGDSPHKVADYARLAVTAYDAAKKANPGAKVGLSVANFDVGFLDAVIKAGAAGHFDFICVHPYENLGAVADGGEAGYLSLAGSLRKMLADNGQRKDIPLWITEVGFPAPIKADAGRDAEQADMLVKAYVLSIAQGFDRIFWFEARGPSYGKGTDLGIIRPDWTPRPAYDALRTMTTLLGEAPRYTGWLDLDGGGFGFVFEGAKGPVLAAWADGGKPRSVRFAAAVTTTDLAGHRAPLAAGADLRLTRAPIFISDLPANQATLARANAGKPFPWGGDYASATAVTCRLGAVNVDDGLKQFSPKTTTVVNDLTGSSRRPDFANPALQGEGHYIYFRVDPRFVPFGTKSLQITVTARRLTASQQAGMKLTYESAKGYRDVADGWWTIPPDDQWHEHTWKLDDANFVGQWGWNFRLDANGSPNEFLIRQARVSKAPPEK